ncbi:hypothetical protein JCM9279_002327 [Rhodotorula babjevae]
MLGRQAATRWTAAAFPSPRLLTPPPLSSIRTRLASTTAKPRSKTARRLRTAGAVGLGVAGVLAWDKEFNADAISRSLRTSLFGVTLALDFKLNFDTSQPDKIDALHERTARRLGALIDTNKGLYIKLGQALAIQAAILPKPYRDALGSVFDSAPNIPWSEVVSVFRGEFGVDPEDAFEYIDRQPLASASIAQVHRARLKPVEGRPWRDGEGWVAVKIRREAIPKQMEADLFCYRALLWTYERLFDMPVAFISQYVSEQMRKEVNLKTEATNAERTARYLADEPRLRDRVVVPKVNWQWTGESVMTADFVDACRLTDKERIAAAGFSLKEVMDTATEAFSAMVFRWGWVHSDPHPGNILVRGNPKHPSRPQVVLIDHGLYVEMSEEFRHQYCLLWRSLFVGDVKSIEDIAVSWGIRRQNSDIFASLTLLRPHRLRKKPSSPEEQTPEERKSAAIARQEQQAGLKDRIKTMLESEELIPRPLIFITRAMRMMQGNNQAVGSPSNRINILAHWAADGLALSTPQHSQSLRALGLRAYTVEKLRLVIFRVVLVFVDVGFVLARVRAWVQERMGNKGERMEDLLEKQVTEMARQEFGVELDDKAFAG